jgi:hypothetical protein
MISLGEALYQLHGMDDISSGPTYVRLSDAEVSLRENNKKHEHKEETNE